MESKVCPTCGESFSMRDDQIPSQFKRQVNCSTDCGRRARHLRRQREQPITINGDGYRLRFVPGRTDGPQSRINRAGAWDLEHRLVMEEVLGRRLQPEEHVHHINEDRLDNRLENLRVMDKSEHIRIHKLGKPRPDLVKPRKACAWCGQPVNHTKARVLTCSLSCAGLLRHHGDAAAPINGGAGVGAVKRAAA